ncbi:MAG: hypothetical protein KAT05_03530 [Spirochaetes bacterium]|nr:hypothetical protein [Spirochaetota bacterium]
MKKYFIITLLLIIFITNVFCKEKTRIAILDFSAKRVDPELAEAIVENLVTALIDCKAFEVIERSQLQKLMNELSLQNSDDFNDKLREDLGNLYGTEMVILGSVTRIGNQITTNVRGVEVSTGIAKFAKSFTTSSENEIPGLIEDLVAVIIGKRHEEVREEDIEYEKEQPINYVYDKKYYGPYLAMKINAGIWTPVMIITLLSGFVCLAAQYYNLYLNKNPGSSFKVMILDETETMADLNKYAQNAINLQKASIAFFCIGGISLVHSIVALALHSFYKKKYEKVASGFLQSNNKHLAFNFDIGYSSDNICLELKLLF